MKVAKKIFVGSIILLLITTPIHVIAGVNENTHPSTLNSFGNNSLGKITIVHLPLYIQYFKFHGINNFDYDPPEDNPGYNYRFCEVDGKVLMNFSLTVEHRLNIVMPFFLVRYTWINDLWIGKGVDYFRIENKRLCVSEAPEIYYVNMTEEDQIVPLETNGENVTLQFYLYGMPVVTTSVGVHTLMELIMPGLKLNFLEDEGGHIPITIIPVQC